MCHLNVALLSKSCFRTSHMNEPPLSLLYSGGMEAVTLGCVIN
jgi:hypothetical protein